MPVMTVSEPAVPTSFPAAPPAVAAAPHRLSDRVLAIADRHRRWVFLAIVLLYAAGFNAQWRLEPDSGLYLSIGRNLAEGLGYTFHGKDHRLAYPGVPVLFFAIFKAFGPDSLVPHLVAMWLMGLATLALTYRLFLLHAGRPTAVLVTLGVAVSRVFYRYSFELLTDLPFLLGVMAFFVGYEAVFHRRSPPDDRSPDYAPSGVHRSNLHLSGGPDAPGSVRQGTASARWFDGVLLVGGLGFAVAARPAMLALVAAAVLAALWSLVRGRARWGHLVVVALVVGAVALFYMKDPRQQPRDPKTDVSTSYVEEDQLFQLKAERLTKMLTTAEGNLGAVFDNALPRATFGVPVAPGINVALGLAIAVAGLLLVRARPLWGMWVLATLLMVLLVPKPLDRYFLPTVPVMVYAWWTFTRGVEARLAARASASAGIPMSSADVSASASGATSRWVRASQLAFLFLFGLGAIPNVLGVFDFVIQQRRVPFLAHYKEGRYASAYEAAALIAQKTGPSLSVHDPQTTWVFVPTKFARAMTLLSRRYCVEPDFHTTVDPEFQQIYALEPTDPLKPDAETRKRPTVRAFLKDRGWEIAPGVLWSVPNADPDDHRPWDLHKVVPIGKAASETSTRDVPRGVSVSP